MTKESVERERELIAQLRESTSVQEVLERARALKWNISENEAREYLALITPDEPKEMESDSQKGGLSLEERLAIDEMTPEEWFAWMAKRNEERQNQMGHPTWEDFFDATERQEKEAILQKMYGGTLTPEEVEAFFPKD